MATKFPGPYINSTKAEDPMMIRVPMDKTDIGARSSGTPKDIKNSNNIVHVGDAATGRK